MLTDERKLFLSKLMVDLIYETTEFYIKKFGDNVLLQMKVDGGFNDISFSEDELKKAAEDHFDSFFQLVRDAKEPLTKATINFVKEMQKCQK